MSLNFQFALHFGKKELIIARAAAGGAVVVTGYFGVNPMNISGK